jgi:CBS domain containing-hemolysin-like protein
LDPDSWLATILVPLCLILLALNSAVETALTNISRLRLHQLLDRGVPRSQALAELLENPRRLPAILLLVNALATLTIGGLAGWLVYQWRYDWPVLVALPGTAMLVLLLGVLVPRALARRSPERAALALYPYVRVLQRLMTPIIGLLEAVAAPLARLIGGREAQPGPFVTEEEMRLLVNVGQEEGVIPAEEERMITSVFAFGDKLVREVMVPRPDVVAAEEQEPISTVVDLVLEHGNTRIPIYRETIDYIVGVVNAKDLLRALHQGLPDVPLRAMARPPYFVPETKKVDELLREMQKERVQLAVVVDEYGGTAGLVTLEDLIEEIVGEIQDEYDTEMPLVEQVGDHEWRFDARVPLSEVNLILGTHWDVEDVDTLGGLVYSHVGRVPKVNDTVTMDDAVITVLTTQGRRLRQLLVTRRGGNGPSPRAEPAEALPLPPRPDPDPAPPEDRAPAPALSANGAADGADRPGPQETRP